MNISVPSEWKVLVSLFTNKIVKMLSHVVNITVHSVSITWCKLWQQFRWQLMQKASYVCHIHFKITNLHITVCGDIDWKRLDRIHSYTFTSDLTKKKTLQCHCDIEKKEICENGEQRRKYKIRKANRGRALLLHAALYEEFQRTGLSLIYILFISESQDSPAQSMANLQKD